ncbi:MAG: GntR family transcriptional regulator [Oscillospiraceae bacterium]|nr:GntR family transcriptional regulator [Oscillospiraceae bacterium]MBQ4642534.1 GntR family transcriptional regulator [Oscillospiraceae bacterium]
MKNFHTTSLADQIFEKLENDIIHGVYPRGEILTELKLVEQLGVSRTPIREALRRLEQERLIEETGKGSRVLGITADDLLDIMNIREHIEGLAAYYACLNMTPEDLKELEHIMDLQDFYFSKGDKERLRQADDMFHDTICELSGRSVIRDTLIPLHRKTRRYRRIAMDDPNRQPRTLQEHKDILNALREGNPDKAREVMDLHIRIAKAHMLEGL